MTAIKEGRGTQKKTGRALRRESAARHRESSPGTGAPRPVRKVDLDECPAGYDPDVWDMTLLFRQEAARERITLAEHSNVLLYAKLERVISPFRESYLAREGKPQTVTGDSPATWQEIVRAAIIRRFGTYVEDGWAADRFCERETFRQMIREVTQRGYHLHLRLLALRDERGHPEVPPAPPRALPSVLPNQPGLGYPDGSDATREYLRGTWLPVARRDFGRRKYAVSFGEAVRNTVRSDWQYEQVADLTEED